MRRILLLCILVTAPVHAGEHALRVAVGVSAPASPDLIAEAVTMGRGLTLGYGLRTGRVLEIGLSVDGNRYDPDEQGLERIFELPQLPDANLLSVEGGGLRVFDLLADIRVHLSSTADDAFTLHLIACAGVTWYRYERAEIEFEHFGHVSRAVVLEREGTGFTLGAGAGFENSFGAWSLFGEARMLHAFAPRDDLVHWPLRLGVKVVQR